VLSEYHGRWRPLENIAGPLSAVNAINTTNTSDGPKQVYATYNGQLGVFWIDVEGKKAMFLSQSAPDQPIRYTLIRITSYPHPSTFLFIICPCGPAPTDPRRSQDVPQAPPAKGRSCPAWHTRFASGLAERVLDQVQGGDAGVHESV